MKRTSDSIPKNRAGFWTEYAWIPLCGLSLALVCSSPVHAQAAGQTTEQGNTPAVQPVTSQGQNSTGTANKKKSDPVVVNETGGIINEQPEDLINQQSYVWAEERRDQSDVVQTPAPQVVNLAGVNQSATSMELEDRGRGPFSFGVESTGIYTTNLFNEFNTGQGGFYTDLNFPIRVYLGSANSNLNVYSGTTTSFYPGNSQLNHWSSIFSVGLNHRASALTNWTTEIAGGRTTGVGTYLPAVIPVGSTSVVQTGKVNGLEPTYNLVGTFGLTRRLSERDRVVTSFTGAFLEQPVPAADPSAPDVITRQQTYGADVHYQHAMNQRSAVGVEFNNIYVRGLNPVGHSNYASVKGTYEYSVSQYAVVQVGAGPLYDLSSSYQYGSSSKMTWTANASINYQTGFGRIGGGYARVVQLGYLLPSSAGNQYFATFDRPLNRYLDMTAAANYVRTASEIQNQVNYSDIGFIARLNFNLARNVLLFAGYSYFDQNGNPFGTTINQTLTYQNVSGGLRYTFGSSLARRGDRK